MLVVKRRDASQLRLEGHAESGVPGRHQQPLSRKVLGTGRSHKPDCVPFDSVFRNQFAPYLNIRVNLWHLHVSESTRCHAKAPNQPHRAKIPRNKG